MRYGGTCNDCLLIKNRASFAGGARYWEGGTLNSCTLSGNWSRYYGGAIHFKDGGNINNSIVWGNTCRDNKGNDIYTYGKSTKRYTCASDGVTQGPDGCFTSNPLFVAAANDDFHLQPNSPCINAGNNTYVFSENDLDDNQRIIAGIVDMGAFEVFTSYRISTTNNMHGSITPESPWVMQGKDQTFVIQPDPGYQLTALTLDGVPVAPVLLYTVTNVQSAQTVCTTFSKITYYVDASRPDDSGDGKSWITAKKTIQAAIDLAADAETVLVTNGVYNVGGTVAPGASVTNRVCITKPIAVESVNGPAVTVIEGAAGSSYPNDVDSVRGVFMTNGCSLIGFTVTKGHAMQSGNFYFDMCGGGIWLTENCVASNCVLTENYATGHGYGGGAYLYQGGSLIHCWLSKNWAYWNGGGAELYQAGSLQNCVLFNNTVYNRGGAVSFSSGGIIKNCTLVENYANEAGGGIYLAYGGTVQNSILWNNSAYFVPDEQNISNYGGELYNSCSSDNVTDGTYACFTNDPLFIEETNGNYQLRYGSPCINAGNNAYAPSDLCDLVGQPRIMGGLIDIGAFEYNSDYTDSNHDGIPDQWYISHALNCTNADTGLGDPDHDGQTTHDEYIAGTDPIAWWSCFKIQSLAHASSNHIHWNSVSGRVYSVYWTTNLLTGFELLKDNLRWPTDTFTNTTHTAKACFYKLKVKLE